MDVLTQIRSTKTYERVTRHEIVRQFVKYAMIGMLNVAVHVGFFNLLIVFGVPSVAANAAAFFVASINSFFLNKRWAFRDQRDQAVVRQYGVFLFFTLVGLALHTGAFSLLLIPLEDRGTLGKNIALLAALPVSVLWNFTSYRRWAFVPNALSTGAPLPTGDRPTTPGPGSAAD
jgi:putative flippase GtrA